MTGKKELAMAVAAGYLLGRRHKLRLALTLALAGATGRLGAARGNLLGQATKVLGSSPELEKIAESVRSGLLEAGKAAAVTAASRQINALSSRLSERATAPLGGVGLDEEESEEFEEEEEPEEAAEKPRRRSAASRKEPQSRAGKQAAATRRPEAKKETATRARKKTSAADEEPEEEKPRKKPVRSRGAATREKTSSSDRPVRRVRG